MAAYRLAVPVMIGALGACLLHAQAVIEDGATAGRSAAASAGAGAGKSVVNIFGKLGQSLAGAAKTSDDGKVPSPPPSKAAPAAAAVASTQKRAEPVVPADLTALAKGMERADMLKKVGKPSMSISSVESSTLVETCWYKSGSDSATVTLHDGKVTAFETASQPKP